MVDDKGARFATKFVQAVPQGSRSVASGAYARTGSALIDEKKRRILQPFVSRATAFVRGRGGDATLADLGKHMKTVQGFALAVRESGLNQRAVIANFLRVFPRRFEVTVPAAGGASRVNLAQRGS